MEEKKSVVESSKFKREDKLNIIRFSGFETVIPGRTKHDSYKIIYEYPEFESFLKSKVLIILEDVGYSGQKILLAYEKGKRYRQVLVSEWIELSMDDLRIYSDAFVENNFFQDRGQMSFNFKEGGE